MTDRASYRSTWLGFAELRPTGRGTLRLHLRWTRIFCALLIMGTIGYFSTATGVYLLYKERRGFSEVTFLDVLLWRRESLRQRQGAADIARGMEALERGAGREAFNYLRTGVGRAPDHLKGRLLLIALYQQGFPKLATELFERGLEYHADEPEYLEAYGRFLIRQREDERLLALMDATLQRHPPESKVSQTMALFGMYTEVRRGRFAEAAALYERHKLGTSADGILEAVEALTRSGRRAEAITLLRGALARREMQSVLTLHSRLIELYLEADEVTLAIERSLDLALMAPLEWQPRILLLNAYEKAGRAQDVQREATAILRQFRHTPEAISTVGQFAQQNGRVDIARQTYEIALEKNFEVPRFALIFIEAHLRAKRFEEALALCGELEAENPAWLADYLPQFNSVRSIASYGAGNAQHGALYQREFLREARNRIEVLHTVGRAYWRAGLLEPAHTVMETAHHIDPQDERVLAALLEIQIELGESRELTQRVNALLDLRRPGYEIFSKARHELASDRFLYAEKRLDLARALDAVMQETAGAPLAFSLPAAG